VPRPATYRELGATPPDEQHPQGSRTWWTRSQAMVIAQTEAAPGDPLAAETSGEYMAILVDGATATIEHGASAERTTEPSVVIVPPGSSTITLDTGGTVFRIFAATAEPQLAALCDNASDYEGPDHNVAGFVAWPDAPSGTRIRVYPLANYPAEPGRLGRIFRCSTVMVNVFEEDPDPRDPAKLSPHHHDDFEQVSLQVDGDYVHHMRVAWAPDSNTWRDDEHHHTHAPAVVVIPPPLIHTSQSVGQMRHWLIDVFAPPRLDFSMRPGWVLNADEYPMPA
jgi:hypothetical protein